MKYGLIGEKLGHSYSKEIHSVIADYDYELCELAPSEVEKFLKKRAFEGINVTIPYKESVIEHLDYLSEEVVSIGAVNTIVNRGGKLYGYNTDYYGIKALFSHARIEVCGKTALVLGTGGTSKTAKKALIDMGAEVYRVSRSSKEDAISYDEAYKYHSNAEIIFNATPCGMFPDVDKTPLDLSKFSSLEGVADAVYNPLSTELVLSARERGIVATGGLYMLAAQAVYASALFGGIDLDGVDESLVDLAYNSVADKKRNLVLIGMPSSGKTTVGKLLEKTVGREFFDTDAELIPRLGRSIAEYFDLYGEKAFREEEKALIAELSKKSGVIIATGGGSVIDPDNVRALKRNGSIILLDRPLDMLTPTSDRPLSSDLDRLKRLYDERRPIYLSAADIVEDGSVEPEAIVANIIKECRL